MELINFVIIVVSTVLMVGCLVYLLIAINRGSNHYKEIRYKVKNNKEVEPWLFDDCSDKEKEKIKQLFEEHNYRLVEKNIKEERLVYGCGKIELANGGYRYQVYYSENCFSNIGEDDYDMLKDKVGKKVTFVQKETVYTNKEFE